MARALCRALLMLTGALISVVGQGHGENKLGPSRGFVRMPGAFHTEVVPIDQNSFKVFLLDIEFKKPVVNQSNVSAKVQDQGQIFGVDCRPLRNFFSCKIQQGASLKSGVLVVSATRLGMVGSEAIFDLPLSLSGKGN